MSDQNLVSATLSATDRDAVLAAINTIATRLPFLIGLSPSDRINLQKMGNIQRSFVEQTVPIANQNAQVLPASLNRTELTADMDLYRQLLPIMDALEPVFEKLDDTLMALGSDPYAALEAYGYVKAAGKSQGLDCRRGPAWPIFKPGSSTAGSGPFHLPRSRRHRPWFNLQPRIVTAQPSGVVGCTPGGGTSAPLR